MLKHILALFLSFAFLAVSSQDFEAELARAKQEQKQVLLVFSGSDWCRPCIEFDKAVLSTAAFKTWQSKNICFYKADLPRNKKKLSEQQIRQNETLAAAYNTEGVFPCLLLIDESGAVLKKKNGSFDNLIDLQKWVAAE